MERKCDYQTNQVNVKEQVQIIQLSGWTRLREPSVGISVGVSEIHLTRIEENSESQSIEEE